jgi:hypothetical protein
METKEITADEMAKKLFEKYKIPVNLTNFTYAMQKFMDEMDQEKEAEHGENYLNRLRGLHDMLKEPIVFIRKMEGVMGCYGTSVHVLSTFSIQGGLCFAMGKALHLALETDDHVLASEALEIANRFQVTIHEFDVRNRMEELLDLAVKHNDKKIVSLVKSLCELDVREAEKSTRDDVHELILKAELGLLKNKNDFGGIVRVMNNFEKDGIINYRRYGQAFNFLCNAIEDMETEELVKKINNDSSYSKIDRLEDMLCVSQIIIRETI